MAAAAAAALPKWVMLERFVFRRDDPKSFRGDERTSATSTTCTGARFEVSFVLAEPPTPSRIYLSWPEGPKDGAMLCHLVAAHRDLVLLRLDSLVDESQQFGDVRNEYFIYIADPTSQVPPSLRPLPPCMEYVPGFEEPWTHPFPLPAVGLLCNGKDEFAVASLSVRHPLDLETTEFQAELWVLRSSLQSCCDDVAVSWEKLLLPIQKVPLPIQYQLEIQLPQEAEYDDLFNWITHDVVPFQNSLCWVNYSRGILFCDDIFGDRPKVSYIPFPLDNSVRNHLHCMCKELYHRLCVTDGGSRLVSVDVTRHDRMGLGPMAPGTGFNLTIRTLDIAENGTMSWNSMADAEIISDQLWAANTEHLPHDLMMLPLLSMDVPNIVYLVLFGWEEGRFSLVAIDCSDKKVLGSVVTYIKSWEEGLSTDDADMVRAKPTFFAPFLPSEFPKFLNLHSSRGGSSSRTRTFSDDEDLDYATADEVGLSQLPNTPPAASQAIQESQPSDQ